jgi:tetratricopeptide (TPR) repeat protein/DNA-binding transcriptional MerR regulator
MADESTNSYTLSDVAQIIGVDEKTLHLYAHKGLIDPNLLTDSTKRFSDVDCARLTVIKRAHELGYESENIFNLIGSPDEVLNADNPVSACQQFAMKKYKEIFNGLADCEPLEQLNKKCDLKLLKSYIINLEGRKEGSPYQVHPPNLEGRKEGSPYQVHPSIHATHPDPGSPSRPKRPSPSATPDESDAQSPRVLSYSVDKLWDYVKNTDPSKTDNAPSEKTLLDEPQQGVPPQTGGAGDETLSEMSMHGFRGSAPLDRLIKSRWWPSGDDEYKTLLKQPVWRNWILSLLILVLAVTGLVKVFGTGDEAPQQQITEDAQSPGQTVDLFTRKEPSPPFPIESSTESDSAARHDTDESDRDQAPPKSTEPVTEPKAPRTEDALEQTVAAIEESDGADSGPLADQPETPQPLPVQVKNISLWHDSLNKIYRAELTIQKNEEIKGEDPISGYAFIHLTADGDQAVDADGLLMPQGEMSSGIPSKIRQGARFSIKNLIQMQIKADSELPPNDVSSGKVLVFSSEGILLLEQPFNVPIQPFFTESTTPPPAPPVATETETLESGESPPETIAELETPTTGDDAAPSPAQEEPLDVSAEAEPQIASVSVVPSAPLVPVTTPSGDGGSEPFGNLAKTDDPNAAIWEQKSYDAAVNGDFDIAIANATKAIELDPGRVNPYINRSWAYIEKNMLQDAIRDCRSALQIDPQNMLAYNNRGLAYQRMAETTLAQEDYRQACDLGLELACQNLEGLINQTRISELINQSQTAFKAQNWEGVIRATTKVIELDPKNAVAYTNRSAAYAQMSYLVKALKDSNEAIAHDPDFSLAYNNRGYVFELLGNTNKAAADYLKSCSLGLNLGCQNFEKLN